MISTIKKCRRLHICAYGLVFRLKLLQFLIELLSGPNSGVLAANASPVHRRPTLMHPWGALVHPLRPCSALRCSGPGKGRRAVTNAEFLIDFVIGLAPEPGGAFRQPNGPQTTLEPSWRCPRARTNPVHSSVLRFAASDRAGDVPVLGRAPTPSF